MSTRKYVKFERDHMSIEVVPAGNDESTDVRFGIVDDADGEAVECWLDADSAMEFADAIKAAAHAAKMEHRKATNKGGEAE